MRPVRLLLALLLTAVAAPGLKSQGLPKLTKIAEVPHLGVGDQGRSSTCWAWAGCSFIESEMLCAGKEAVKLSPMSIVRWCYGAKMRQFIRMHGDRWYGGGGEFSDVWLAVEEWGLMPSSVYHDSKYARAMNNEDVLERMGREAVSKEKGIGPSAGWQSSFNALMDHSYPALPDSFLWEGGWYTPRRFADKVVGFDWRKYLAVTSFSHHPWWSSFSLEVPDNWMMASYYNMPLGDLEAAMQKTLRGGRSFVISLDVTEAEFSDLYCRPIKGGDLRGAALDAERLRQFDDYRTQDDHALHVVGLYTDAQGNLYYKAKNSWGADHGEQGYLYISSSYMRLKLMSAVLPREVLSPVEEFFAPSS